MRTVALHTLGCKLNYTETSSIARQFVERGYQLVDSHQPSDIFVLNTCSVTERAAKECRQLIRRALRQSEDTYVVVLGCYAQLSPDEIAAIEGVDLIMGAKEKFKIFEHAGNFSKNPTPQIFVSCIDEATDFDPASSADGSQRTRAFLKIQDGCDYNCAFCTIPLARGTSRSRPVTDIVKQAEEARVAGFREIVLTGVNVGDYGRKIGSDLIELMKALDALTGIDRIRISSVEPNLLTREMVDFMLASEKFCNHFHIPLQSGSDTLLRSMRRRYARKTYSELVDYIKGKDAGAGIGMDVITGFPGETDRLFLETFEFIADLPISYLHVFTYSERPATEALRLGNAVEPKVRFKRNEILRELGKNKRRKFYSSSLGKRLPVLFEGNIRNGLMSGLTPQYIRVETTADEKLINKICNVTITGIGKDSCIAEVRN